MSLITGTSEPSIITDAAVDRIKTLLAKENKPEAGLRLYISGGGCAGMSYGMSIDDAVSADDAVVKTKGVKVLVDKLSLIYLRGSKIDFVENLQTSGFQIDNPNALLHAAVGCPSKQTRTPLTKQRR